METHESLEKTLMQVTESQIKHFLEKLANLEVGDLKSLEGQVMSTIKTMGCLIMEATLNAKAQEQPLAGQKEGACGHKMRLVGMRGKRLQTLMGPVTLWRAYSHCAGRRASGKADVYREVKVGAVFEAEPGRKRSELVPGVFVDTAGPKAQYISNKTRCESNEADAAVSS